MCIDQFSVQRLMAGIKDAVSAPMAWLPPQIPRYNMRVDGASMAFDALSNRAAGDTTIITDIRFPMLGDHNVQNCLPRLLSHLK